MKLSQIMPYGLRMQPDLRDWLQQQASANHRSLNSEILVRLEESRKTQQEATEQPQK